MAHGVGGLCDTGGVTTIPSPASEASPSSGRAPQTRDLSRFAYLSIAAAVVTITLKVIAWRITGSVGLLSDAAESVVNLVAAIAVLIALKVAAMPADKNHHFGHTKAEYFSAAIEGMMIFVAALVIMYTAVERFLNPQPIENVGIGLAISVVASAVNGAVAVVLLRAGRRYRSLTLTADGKHLMTDVWTSAGVVVGVLLVGAHAHRAARPRHRLPRRRQHRLDRLEAHPRVHRGPHGHLDAQGGQQRDRRDPRRASSRARSTSTRCARASRATTASPRCTCSCPARGPSSRGTTSWRRSRRPSTASSARSR